MHIKKSLFLRAAGRHTHDLSGEIFIKAHLLYSRFHSLDPNTPSIHKEKHTPLYLYWLLQMWLSNEMWWKALSDNNRRHRGDVLKNCFLTQFSPDQSHGTALVWPRAGHLFGCVIINNHQIILKSLDFNLLNYAQHKMD